jgi:hypothetical protein
LKQSKEQRDDNNQDDAVDRYFLDCEFAEDPLVWQAAISAEGEEASRVGYTKVRLFRGIDESVP